MSEYMNQSNEDLPSSFEEREVLEKKRYKLAKKQDLFIILGILILALSFWIYSLAQGRGEKVYAQITYFNQELDQIVLTGAMERTFSYPEDPDMVFQVTKDGGIRVVSADCPDQICVNSGVIYRAGSFIACVPNGFLVSVRAETGQLNEEVDIVN